MISGQPPHRRHPQPHLPHDPLAAPSLAPRMIPTVAISPVSTLTGELNGLASCSSRIEWPQESSNLLKAFRVQWLKELILSFEGLQGFRVYQYITGFSEVISRLSSFQGPRVSKVQVLQSQIKGLLSSQGCSRVSSFSRASRVIGSHFRVRALNCTPTYHLLLVAV